MRYTLLLPQHRKETKVGRRCSKYYCFDWSLNEREVSKVTGKADVH